jgi:hypothetical protein
MPSAGKRGLNPWGHSINGDAKHSAQQRAKHCDYGFPGSVRTNFMSLPGAKNRK